MLYNYNKNAQKGRSGLVRIVTRYDILGRKVDMMPAKDMTEGQHGQSAQQSPDQLRQQLAEKLEAYGRDSKKWWPPIGRNPNLAVIWRNIQEGGGTRCAICNQEGKTPNVPMGQRCYVPCKNKPEAINSLRLIEDIVRQLGRGFDPQRLLHGVQPVQQPQTNYGQALTGQELTQAKQIAIFLLEESPEMSKFELVEMLRAMFMDTGGMNPARATNIADMAMIHFWGTTLVQRWLEGKNLQEVLDANASSKIDATIMGILASPDGNNTTREKVMEAWNLLIGPMRREAEEKAKAADQAICQAIVDMFLSDESNLLSPPDKWMWRELERRNQEREPVPANAKRLEAMLNDAKKVKVASMVRAEAEQWLQDHPEDLAKNDKDVAEDIANSSVLLDLGTNVDKIAMAVERVQEYMRRDLARQVVRARIEANGFGTDDQIIEELVQANPGLSAHNIKPFLHDNNPGPDGGLSIDTLRKDAAARKRAEMLAKLDAVRKAKQGK